jgi:hypothetical protein
MSRVASVTYYGRCSRLVGRETNPRPRSDNFLPLRRGKLFDELDAPQTNASSHVPRVAALEYSVERFSKKLVCSMALSIWSIQGSGFLASCL